MQTTVPEEDDDNLEAGIVLGVVIGVIILLLLLATGVIAYWYK